jgi:hypothetical protein
VQVTDAGVRARIDTQVPRGEHHAYWITYTATDAVGNVGTGLRQVLITCPEGEIICWEFDDSRPSACSLNGKCVDKSLSSAVASVDVDGTCPEHVKVALLNPFEFRSSKDSILQAEHLVYSDGEVGMVSHPMILGVGPCAALHVLNLPTMDTTYLPWTPMNVRFMAPFIDLCSAADKVVDDEHELQEPPKLLLRGPAKIVVTASSSATPYALCPSNAPADLVCDAGVELATGEEEGDLLAVVSACHPDSILALSGLAACTHVQLDVAGTYTVSYSVSNSHVSPIQMFRASGFML